MATEDPVADEGVVEIQEPENDCGQEEESREEEIDNAEKKGGRRRRGYVSSIEGHFLLQQLLHASQDLSYPQHLNTCFSLKCTGRRSNGNVE